jgi:membrane protein YdbS with pleckstrin-like domain
VSIDVAKGKQLLVKMTVAESLLLLPAIGFAFGHFRFGVGWMLWAFVGCLIAAMAVQLWFISRVARMNNGA